MLSLSAPPTMKRMESRDLSYTNLAAMAEEFGTFSRVLPSGSSGASIRTRCSDARANLGWTLLTPAASMHRPHIDGNGPGLGDVVCEGDGAHQHRPSARHQLAARGDRVVPARRGPPLASAGVGAWRADRLPTPSLPAHPALIPL